jgi:signal transduction histidine kinase
LALLNKIGSRIAAMLELDSLLAEAVRLVQDFGYPHVALYTLDQEREELLLRASVGASGPGPTHGHQAGLDQDLVDRVAERGECLLVNDLSADLPSPVPGEETVTIRSELAVPLRLGGKVVGVLEVQSPRPDAFDQNDVMVMETLSDQIATAIHNAELYEAERAAQERLRDLAGYLETARERERTHIAREIHDEFGQALTALKMDLAWLSRHLPATSSPLLDKAEAMSELIDATIQMVRRIATDLRPGILDHLGLVAAIEWQAQEVASRAGFACELSLEDLELDLDPDLATAVFRIFQETLTNVARHAEATAIRVVFRARRDELMLLVKDNGRGMTEGQHTAPQSLGLLGTQERARSWGGEVMYESAPGQGTTVTVRVPRVGRRDDDPSACGR